MDKRDVGPTVRALLDDIASEPDLTVRAEQLLAFRTAAHAEMNAEMRRTAIQMRMSGVSFHMVCTLLHVGERTLADWVAGTPAAGVSVWNPGHLKASPGY